MARLIHFELNVENIQKTIKFYEGVFGWKFEKWEGPQDYWLITTGDESETGIDGGLGLLEEGFPTVVNTIEVGNIDEVIKTIKKNGGEIIRPKHAVPGVGWIAYFKDLEGIVSGIMQEDPDAK
ncbi:MAG: VOC family protein [Candidatus Lokiarchaeota archaeon]|nr:VOC family protein [Candidatus Lokiarchaeota archaeon]MBD3202334.1 VOC family protein [Candidatus Lokiarchaeota archaeon]